LAPAATREASWAPEALERTVAVTSSSAAAVSSSVAACRSVRRAISPTATRISSDPPSRPDTESAMAPKVSFRLRTALLKSSLIWA
jgi:hypothetical protein